MRLHPWLFRLGAAGAAFAVIASASASAAPRPAQSHAPTVASRSVDAAAHKSSQAAGEGSTVDPVPAPDGFAGEVSGIYSGLVAIIASKAGDLGLQVPSTSSFNSSVAALDPNQLTALYNANPQIWGELQNYLAAVPMTSLKATRVDLPALKRAAASRSGGSTTVAPNTASRAAAEPFPPPPESQTCLEPDAANALVDTTEGLELGSLALDAAASGVSRDIVAEILGEGSSIVDPVFTVIETAARALDASKTVIEVVLAQNDICEAANNDAANEFIISALESLGQTSADLSAGQTTIENNETDISNSITNDYNSTLQKIANLQTSQNSGQTSLDLALKERIEAALLGGATSTLTDFELPASANGYLDATPIGVKQIVTDALAAMKATGQTVSSAAARDLVLSNNELAAGQYKKAYAEYQLTYQAIAKP